MTDWPKYVSHKVVSATPIVRIDRVASGAGIDVPPVLWVDPSNGREAPVRFEPTEPKMAHRCQVLDYAMTYRDGYRSVCPRKEFEDGYSPEPAA